MVVLILRAFPKLNETTESKEGEARFAQVHLLPVGSISLPDRTYPLAKPTKSLSSCSGQHWQEHRARDIVSMPPLLHHPNTVHALRLRSAVTTVYIASQLT
jgi:hypothetical protein